MFPFDNWNNRFIFIISNRYHNYHTHTPYIYWKCTRFRCYLDRFSRAYGLHFKCCHCWLTKRHQWRIVPPFVAVISFYLFALCYNDFLWEFFFPNFCKNGFGENLENVGQTLDQLVFSYIDDKTDNNKALESLKIHLLLHFVSWVHFLDHNFKTNLSND